MVRFIKGAAPKRTALSILIGSMFLLSGCDDSQPEVRIVYKDPTPEQIQSAVDDALSKLNKDDAELKAFLEEIKKTNPEVIGARYAYENGEKVLKVAMGNEQNSGLSEYVVPVATGALAGYAGATLAQKLVSRTRPSVNGSPDCDLDDLLEGDPDCRQRSNGATGWHFSGYPTYHYDDSNYYDSTVKKERRVYSQQSSKKSAAETAKAIKAKASSDHVKLAEARTKATNERLKRTEERQKPTSSTQSSYDSRGLDSNGRPRNGSNSAYKSNSATSKSYAENKVAKATLTEKRQAFSTKRSTSRSSSMNFNSSSSKWGG